MNTFIIIIFALVIAIFVITVIALVGYLVFNSISLENEPIIDKENRVVFKKHLKSSCTFVLGFRGGVRSFNGLFRNKDLKKFMELKNDKG